MKQDMKVAFIRGAMASTFAVGEAVFLHWVGDINWWVAWFIASSSSAAAYVQSQVTECRSMLNINNRKLESVFELAKSLTDRVDDLEGKIEQLQIRRNQ